MSETSSSIQRTPCSYAQLPWMDITLSVATVALAVLGTLAYFNVGALGHVTNLAAPLAYTSWAIAGSLLGIEVIQRIVQQIAVSANNDVKPLHTKENDEKSLAGIPVQQRRSSNSSINDEYVTGSIMPALNYEFKYLNCNIHFIGIFHSTQQPQNFPNYEELEKVLLDFQQSQNQNPTNLKAGDIGTALGLIFIDFFQKKGITSPDILFSCQIDDQILLLNDGQSQALIISNSSCKSFPNRHYTQRKAIGGFQKKDGDCLILGTSTFWTHFSDEEMTQQIRSYQQQGMSSRSIHLALSNQLSKKNLNSDYSFAVIKM